MEHDSTLHLRMPRKLRDELDELHENTRVPVSEVVRFLIETGLGAYRRGKHFDADRLVVDVAEHVHDQEPARTRRTPRTHAAA